jgi:Flp pilus assembly protein TadD
VRSVSTIILLAAMAALLAGCVTTQQRSARAQLHAQHVLAARAHHHHHRTHQTHRTR